MRDFGVGVSGTGAGSRGARVQVRVRVRVRVRVWVWVRVRRLAGCMLICQASSIPTLRSPTVPLTALQTLIISYAVHSCGGQLIFVLILVVQSYWFILLVHPTGSSYWFILLVHDSQQLRS